MQEFNAPVQNHHKSYSGDGDAVSIMAARRGRENKVRTTNGREIDDHYKSRVCVAFFCSIIFCVVTNVFSPVFRNPNTLRDAARASDLPVISTILFICSDSCHSIADVVERQFGNNTQVNVAGGNACLMDCSINKPNEASRVFMQTILNIVSTKTRAEVQAITKNALDGNGIDNSVSFSTDGTGAEASHNAATTNAIEPSEPDAPAPDAIEAGAATDPTTDAIEANALDPVAPALNATKGEVALDAAENRSTKSKKALLIIAISPTTDALRFAATWSILECFAADFDKIVISSSHVLHRNQTASVPAYPFVTSFLRKVREAMPDVGSKIEDRYFFNNRYDAGLWCDTMVSTSRNSNISILEKGTENRTSYVGGSSEYDRFMLINDSMMAVRKTNEFLTALEEKKADLVSLNSWGKNATDPNFWVESPLRVFSLRGIQEYADRICSLGEIQPARDCPWLLAKPGEVLEETFGREGMERASRKERTKRCITVKTEIEVAKFYPPDKVFGLYPSYLEEIDGSQTSWTISYRVWKELRDKMSFPALKVSHPETMEPVMRLQPEDTKTCTNLYDEHWIERVDLLKMPLEFVS